MKYSLEQWFLWFVIYSLIGWVYESILCSVAGKKLVNRGFLNGPVSVSYTHLDVYKRQFHNRFVALQKRPAVFDRLFDFRRRLRRLCFQRCLRHFPAPPSAAAMPLSPHSSSTSSQIA